MAETLAWWVVVQVMALAALPVTLAVLRRLPDLGYAFSKPLGILLTGWVFWIALTIGVLPNRPGSVVWALLIVGAASLYLYVRSRDATKELLRERRHVILAVEALFFVALFTAAHLRSFIPEISATEKPMDFLFLNAADRSPGYPPADPWFAGASVSYYYFGYVLQAMLGKLAFQPTEVTFNLAVAGTAALTAVAAFGLGYNLSALYRQAGALLPFVGGAMAVLLVLVLGNLEGVLEFMAANGLGSEGFFRSMAIAGLENAGESGRFYPTEQSSMWWWWRATRLHPEANAIMEFPFFSFLLGDLHPHVMAIPFVLTAVALGLSLWLSDEPLAVDYWRGGAGFLFVSAVLIGALAFLNAWDLPTFAFVVAALVVVRNLRDYGLRDAFVGAAGFLLPLATLAFVLYLPFYLGFSSQASGLRADESEGTRPLHAFLFWAPLYLVALLAPLLVLNRYRASVPREWWQAAISFLGLLLLAWVLLIALNGSGRFHEAVANRGLNWTSAAAFAAGLGVSVLALARLVRDPDHSRSPLVPSLVLTSTAMLLVLGAEMFFIQDVFNSRLNTVFKLYYQAWLLLGVSGAFNLAWVLVEWRPAQGSSAAMLKGALATVAAAAIAAALLYPLGATLSRTEGLARPHRTLDGLAFARAQMTDDYNAAMWLRDRAERHERVLEAVGGSYTGFGRVSAWTGIPTVMGWPGHQLQWGRPGALVTLRQQEVDRAYSTGSLEEALSILRQYGVTYVFVGSLERSKYPAAGLTKFEVLPTAYRSGSVAVYRVPAAAGQGERSPAGAAGR
jgi:YYY domain-containing protein